MTCPRCKRPSPPGAKFCVECGAPLALACGKCGTPVPAGARFCPECAHPVAAPAEAARFGAPQTYTPRHLADKILTSRSALEGERKQVTVLFADVSGFTSLSAQLDPEDAHVLMNQAFELMLDEVHRYEGTVNQFLGDGIMALFGAPIAHEEHAQRAAHAALGIQRRLDELGYDLERRRGIAFQVRQGLNTGLVVVGSIGTDLRMDYTAVGDTTNVAARLQQIAAPGRVVVSAATHRLIDGYFHTRALGDVSLKGKPEPVPVWELISRRAARTRLEVEAERGLTPFVGRERELGLLHDAFERARAGHGQIVFVAGEPGIGKSRLLLEFRRRLGGEGTWVEGHCMSFGRSIAFHPRPAEAHLPHRGGRREPAYEAYALQLVGEITADRDQRAAEPRYREALSLAERLGMRPLVGRCHLRLRALARAIGHREEAECHLQTSSSLFREMGMPLWLARAEAAAG